MASTDEILERIDSRLGQIDRRLDQREAEVNQLLSRMDRGIAQNDVRIAQAADGIERMTQAFELSKEVMTQMLATHAERHDEIRRSFADLSDHMRAQTEALLRLNPGSS